MTGSMAGSIDQIAEAARGIVEISVCTRIVNSHADQHHEKGRLSRTERDHMMQEVEKFCAESESNRPRL